MDANYRSRFWTPRGIALLTWTFMMCAFVVGVCCDTSRNKPVPELCNRPVPVHVCLETMFWTCCFVCVIFFGTAHFPSKQKERLKEEKHCVRT